MFPEQVVLMSYPVPCYTKYGPWTPLVLSGALLEMQNLRSVESEYASLMSLPGVA